MRSCWGWLACVCLLAGPAWAQTPAVQAPSPSAAEIAAWVADLDANEFAKREAATEKLMAGGAATIKALAALDLSRQNLEVITRGLYVLQELAQHDDSAIEDAAREVLESLRAAANPVAAERAAATLAAINDLRSDRALVALQKVGVRFAIVTSQIGPVFVSEVPTLEIDDKFTGKPEDLKRLRYLHQVRAVNLSGGKVSDEVVQRVVELPALQYLSIKRAAITSACSKDIPKLTTLQHLSFRYCSLDDRLIGPLLELKSLNTLELYGVGVSRQAADQLRTALAGTKIDYRQGAFLGIGCAATPEGCRVTIVHPNSAAAKAGILPDDIIVSFAGAKIKDFEALTAEISKYKAGDKVAFEILREKGFDNVDKLQIEATLGEWE